MKNIGIGWMEDNVVTGSVRVTIGEWKGKVAVQFEKSVECISFSPEIAEKLARGLMDAAKDLKKEAAD